MGRGGLARRYQIASVICYIHLKLQSNDIDSVIKMHCSPSCLHNQIMIICVANVTIRINV